MNEGKWKGKKERQKDEQKKGENVPGKGGQAHKHERMPERAHRVEGTAWEDMYVRSAVSGLLSVSVWRGCQGWD